MSYSSAIEAAAEKGSFALMRSLLAATAPSQVNPSLEAGVAMINDARDVSGFVPYPGIPDPAQTQMQFLRTLLPPQVGMLLTSVPPGSGSLRRAETAVPSS